MAVQSTADDRPASRKLEIINRNACCFRTAPLRESRFHDAMPCHPTEKAANDEMRRLIDEHEMSESDLERDDNVSDIEEMVADNIHSRTWKGGPGD